VPAECDVSIRPGWFYHAKEDEKVRTAQNLLDLYFASIGRGASFLLNLPVDRRGRIPDKDAQSLSEFRRLIDRMFAVDIAKGSRIDVSNVRGRASRFSGANVSDGRRDTYWSTDDSVTNPSLILDLRQPRTFNVVRLREYLPLGQRVESFALDEWQQGEWQQFATGTSIGNCRLTRTGPITTTKVRLRIIQAAACPAISEVALFAETTPK
jgi:alpha-L-fucosidase